LAFGISRADAREALGPNREVFRRAPFEPAASELYPDAGVVLGFGPDERLGTIEMTPGADPVLSGVRLLAGSADDVLAALRDAGVAPEWTPSGWAIPELGISFGEVREGCFSSVLSSATGNVVFAFDFFTATAPPTVTAADLAVRAAHGFAPGVEIGAHRADLRRLLGSGVASVSDSGPIDHFMGAGIVAGYDDDGVVVALTAIGPATPAYEGMVLLNRTAGDLHAEAIARGFEVVAGETVLAFSTAGFRAWTMRAEADSPVVAVAIP
jgi:hypothetical protein